MKLTFTSDITVDCIAVEASDERAVQAARVSTLGAESEATAADGLVRYLLKNRHMTPFEHNMFTFRVTAPIFVWREHMRHRIGFSYNEESGRYKQLDPVFYAPSEDRNLIQVGKPGHYTYEPGDRHQYGQVLQAIKTAAVTSYGLYESLLANNIAK